jgi:hypothetical protein
MKADSARRSGAPPHPAGCRHRPVAAWLILSVATALGGCANLHNTTADLPPPISQPISQPDSHPDSAVLGALAYHQSIRKMSAGDLARERSAQTGTGATPLHQLRLTMLLSHPPGGGNLPRAMSLLDAIGASDKPQAVALQPLARLLADQLQERQRLEHTAERLTQQLERTGQQLKDSQKEGQLLQEKLDALTEIERTLPAPPVAPAALPPPQTERRNAR